MKAKVIATGEIVEVEFLLRTSEGKFVYREIPTLPTSRMFQQKELMFFEVNPEKKIDWEQRRFELVKVIAGGVMSVIDIENSVKERFATFCVEYADAVIAKLKEE